MGEDEHNVEATRAGISSDMMRIIGLLVFLAGVVMIIMVFAWGYALLSTIDSEISQLSTPARAVNPAALAGSETAEAAPPQVAIAAPSSGPSLLQVAAVIGLKLIVMVVMAWAGALVAGKGAAMARRQSSDAD